MLRVRIKKNKTFPSIRTSAAYDSQQRERKNLFCSLGQFESIQSCVWLRSTIFRKLNGTGEDCCHCCSKSINVLKVREISITRMDMSQNNGTATCSFIVRTDKRVKVKSNSSPLLRIKNKKCMDHTPTYT